MANAEEKILDIRVNYEDAIRKIAEYRTQLDLLKKVEQTLKEDVKEGRISREKANIKLSEAKIATKEYTDAIRVLNKEINNSIKADKAQDASIAQLRAQLSNLNAEYDRMSRSMREAADGKALLSSIQGITAELNAAEQASGRFNRNVGNYASGMHGLNLQLQQVARELPSLAVGASTFMLAISNNIPMLTDEIRKARVEYNALVAEGKNATPVWKQLLSSLFSWQTALVAGITILTVYGKEIFAWAGNLFKANKAVSESYETMDSYKKKVSETSGEVIATLERLSVGWKRLGGDVNAQKKFIIENKEAIDGMGVSVTNAADAENLFNKNKDAFILGVMQRAKAAAVMDLASAEYKKAVEKMMEADKRASEEPTFGDRLKSILAQSAAGQDLSGSLKQSELTAQKMKEDSVKRQRKEIESILKSSGELVQKYVQFSEEEVRMLESIGIKSTETIVAGSIEAIEASISLKQQELKRITDPIEYKKVEAQIKAEQAKLKAITGVTEKEAKDVRDREIEEVRKAEDAMLSLLKDGVEKKKAIVNSDAKRETEDLKRKLSEDKNLTKKGRDAINEQIKLVEAKRISDINKLSDEEIKKQIEISAKILENKLSAAKKGSQTEFDLKMKLINTQRDIELSALTLTEKQKLSIIEKYNNEERLLTIKSQEDLFSEQQNIIKAQFQQRLFDVRGNDEEELRIKIEQKQQELNTLHQLEGESEAEFNIRRIELATQFKDLKKQLSDEELDTEIRKAEAISMLMGGIMNLTDAMSEKSEAAVILSKTLAIAQVAISQGVAIAKAVETATRSSASWVDMLIAIATVVAGVTTVMGSAMKSVKSAKFATGGYVSGPGTESSDSIPAQLSNGESVINARSTDMFAPILSAMNMAGGGVPINVQSTSNQTIGEDMLARAVAKGVMMAPPPVLSVEEYTTVSNRVRYVENLGDL